MKKVFLLFAFIITGTLAPFKVLAGSNDSALNKKVTQWMSNANGIRFLENKGQMMDMQRKAVNNVLFEAGAGGVDVYVTTEGLSYVFTKMDKHKKANSSAMPNKMGLHNDVDDSVTGQYCRADMQLVGADIRKENIVKEDESSDRKDYYYGDVCPNGILNVHTYGKVTIKNIYPGIDWVLHSGKNGLKYDFIVHPGATPSLIRLKYKWTDKPQLQDDGSLKISTPMGSITEGTPVSYSADKQVQTTYNIENNEIHFKVGNYNSTETLIIDPKLVWATYYGYGVFEQDDVYSMQDDGSSIWLTGHTYSIRYPRLNPGGGAYFQGALAGQHDAFILQFSIAGVRKWATYYGGASDDEATSICSDGAHVWVTGYTQSTNFPTLNPGGGAYFQATRAGSMNAFILQFNTAGVRIWATYYGGNSEDCANSIHSDGTNVWLTGYTFSTSFPTFNPGGGAYFQGALNNGTGNAFMLQFSTTGIRKWATYYGGNMYDLGYSIHSDGKNVWVTGYVSSTNFPTLNPGGGAYFQGALAGSYNLFVLQFSTTGVRKWATYYGGNSMDYGYSIYSDGKYVWLTGKTYSSNFPTLNPGHGAYFQGALPGNSDAFIMKFDTSGIRKWATYYGGSAAKGNGDGGTSIQSEGSNVWVCGYTSSPDFPTQNPGCGFFQDTLGINSWDTIGIPSQDVFILRFDTAGVRQWATYYGTDVENDGSYIWSDGTNLFVAGDANYAGYPALNPGGGAYYFDTTAIDFNNEIIFIGKFNTTPGNLVVSPTLSICRGQRDTISASGASSYSWSPAAGLSATNIPNPVASPTITTTYTVTTTGGCAGTAIDSVKVIVDTFNLKNITLTKDTAICSGSSITLSAGGGISYQWSTGAITSSISITNDSATHIYTLSVSDGVCKTDTSVTVTVKPKPNGNVSGNLFICHGNSTTLVASGGTAYIWSTGETTSAITISPSSDTNYSVVIIQNGCAETLSESVTIISLSNIHICCDSIITAGQTVQLISPGGYSYFWFPSTGLNCDTCANPIATPSVTTWYYEIIISDSGCKAKDSVLITILNPTESKSCGEVFIPNVFTPNEGSYNNILYVRDPCIASMDFLVFDRWGNKVFESQNINNGWDGTYKGQAMNVGTYVWYLKATLQDGTSLEKKGDVTLVR